MNNTYTHEIIEIDKWQRVLHVVIFHRMSPRILSSAPCYCYCGSNWFLSVAARHTEIDVKQTKPKSVEKRQKWNWNGNDDDNGQIWNNQWHILIAYYSSLEYILFLCSKWHAYTVLIVVAQTLNCAQAAHIFFVFVFLFLVRINLTLCSLCAHTHFYFRWQHFVYTSEIIFSFFHESRTESM